MQPQFKLNGTAVENILGLMLLSYPALLFLVRGGMNGVMFVLVLFSLYLLATGCRQRAPLSSSEIAFGIAMSSGLVAIFLSQLYHHELSARHFDSASRFLLAVPIVYALRYAGGARMFSAMQYAFPLGAIAALIAVVAEHPSTSYSASTSFMNHIHLGDTAILLAFLSLFSINWIRADGLAVKALKISGVFAGLIVTVLSQARGGWVAIPIFVAVYIYAHSQAEQFRRLVVVAATAGLVVLLSYLFIDPVQLRIGMIFSDLSQFQAGNIDTSIGVRLQLWSAAIQLIVENPIFGVGADGFGGAMGSLSEQGLITPIAAELGRGEVHSEILAQTVRFGVFGLGFILAVYFVPLYYFLKLAKSANRQQAVPALMGICVTLGFFVFGLTVETFNLKMTAAFYCTTIAALFAAASTRIDIGSSVQVKN
ncbi:MAG: O-antigen ligase family protein [Gammaproteobacteria bacterium]|nr:O-antigen ligase family protein [Gammaproteobacteria bacterium]